MPSTPISYLGPVPLIPSLSPNAVVSPRVASSGGAPLGPFPYAQVLQSGVTGTAYSETISAYGGVLPYTNFAVTGGSLPTSLSLNTSTGAITGTPTATGTFTFQITVTDSAANQGSQTFEIIIGAPAASGSALTFGA